MSFTGKLYDIATALRIRCTGDQSCSSAAEIVSVLLFHTMKYSVEDPKHPANDRLILSKGYAAPLLFATNTESVVFQSNGLDLSEENIDLKPENHNVHLHPSFVDIAISLSGQGVGVGCGMAYCGKYIDKSNYRVFCLLRGKDCTEGTVWEAFDFAVHYNLDNLVFIIDIDRASQREQAALGWNSDLLKARFSTFGIHCILADGHDVSALVSGFEKASTTRGKPTALICQTISGKENGGVVASLKVDQNLNGLTPQKYIDALPKPDLDGARLSEPPNYKLGSKFPTRKIFGEALVKIGKTCPRLLSLDADTKNSTFSEIYEKAFNNRFIECSIAEQNMIGVGIGLEFRDRNIVFCSTFACFLTRTFDQIRMGANLQSNCNFVGSHAGVSIGEDGAVEMALEDIAMFRSLPSSSIFYPCDAVSTEHSILLAAKTKGITFTRTTRCVTPVIYSCEESFEVGKGKLIYSSDDDQVTVVGAGITVHEAIKAYQSLKEEGIKIRVIDPFTIKPIDKTLLVSAVTATNGRIITVEDHHPEGGLGEAVASVLTEERRMLEMVRLAVREIPRSGPGEVLMDLYGISARWIINTVKSMLSE